jgi:hypothetical protein
MTIPSMATAFKDAPSGPAAQPLTGRYEPLPHDQHTINRLRILGREDA